jgi:5-oxoprolinase (ATP-hydrolysing) subunit A
MTHMDRCVDLNADVGEGYGAFRIGSDEELLHHVTSANIACGWHAGDPLVMGKTAELCCRLQVSAGAHPGYPDLQGFGRRNMQLSERECRAFVLYQVGALSGFLRRVGTPMRHVKPHGALYNQASGDESLARGIVGAIVDFDPTLILLGLSGSRLLETARERGLKVAREVFADRAYNSDGSLVSRKLPGALIEDPAEAADRAVRMVTEGILRSIDGTDIPIEADSICIHGDRPGSVEVARRLREALQRAAVSVRPLVDFIT